MLVGAPNFLSNLLLVDYEVLLLIGVKEMEQHTLITLCSNIFMAPNQARLPAELKHINKRRKRNQQGLP